jgi:hypothetical protein
MGATTYVVPAIVVLMSWAFLGQTPRPLAYLGGALCLAGVAVSRGQAGQQRHPCWNQALRNRSPDSGVVEELFAGRQCAVRVDRVIMLAAPADPADQLVGDGDPPPGVAAERPAERGEAADLVGGQAPCSRPGQPVPFEGQPGQVDAPVADAEVFCVDDAGEAPGADQGVRPCPPPVARPAVSARPNRSPSKSASARSVIAAIMPPAIIWLTVQAPGEA